MNCLNRERPLAVGFVFGPAPLLALLALRGVDFWTLEQRDRPCKVLSDCSKAWRQTRNRLSGSGRLVFNRARPDLGPHPTRSSKPYSTPCRRGPSTYDFCSFRKRQDPRMRGLGTLAAIQLTHLCGRSNQPPILTKVRIGYVAMSGRAKAMA